jgi:hypothetical protein
MAPPVFRRHFADFACLALLLLPVICLFQWRWHFIATCPDLDTDAAGHFVIGRTLIERPWDLKLHWVWLPLFHYGQALFSYAFDMRGAAVRMFNCVLVALAPFALFGMLRRRADDRWMALAASFLYAMSAFASHMGTTGQPEPLFVLLTIVAVGLARDMRKIALLTLVLSTIVMLRYEGWGLWVSLAAIMVWWWLRPSSAPGGMRKHLFLWPILTPGLVILAWAIARRPFDGEWFWFVRATKDFAWDAMHIKAISIRDLPRDLTLYTLQKPWLWIGYPIVLIPFGIVRACKKQGPMFAAATFGVLAMITLTWIRKSSLGLDRHFNVLLPFFWVFVVEGAIVVGNLLARLLRAIHQPSELADAAKTGAIAGILTALIACTWYTTRGYLDMWDAIGAHSFEAQKHVVAILRHLPTTALIACDDVLVETMAALSRKQFLHAQKNAKELRALAKDRIVWAVIWDSRGEEFAADSDLILRENGLLLVRMRGQ